MKLSQKITMLKSISTRDISIARDIHEILLHCNLLKPNYYDYMLTHPINCDKELLRLSLADYDLCCALLTMLLREDHFCNGSLERRIRNGDIKQVADRLIHILESERTSHTLSSFSEKALNAINGYYVYALADPRTNKVFYIGKGTGNRVFSHEAESGNSAKTEKDKLLTIKDIENNGFRVKRIMINWGLTESEAFAAEAALINLLNIISDTQLTNIASGHHVHECLTVEQFELIYGAEMLKPEDIKHSILVIKINKLYHTDMSSFEVYDAVRGMWRASLRSIRSRNIRYDFAVYNGLIVVVYKHDEWHYVYENIDLPQRGKIDAAAYEHSKNRVYFVCNNYDDLDDEGRFYLHKSITGLKMNHSSQNPISYLSPADITV